MFRVPSGSRGYAGRTTPSGVIVPMTRDAGRGAVPWTHASQNLAVRKEPSAHGPRCAAAEDTTAPEDGTAA